MSDARPPPPIAEAIAVTCVSTLVSALMSTLPVDTMVAFFTLILASAPRMITDRSMPVSALAATPGTVPSRLARLLLNPAAAAGASLARLVSLAMALILMAPPLMVAPSTVISAFFDVKSNGQLTRRLATSDTASVILPAFLPAAVSASASNFALAPRMMVCPPASDDVPSGLVVGIPKVMSPALPPAFCVEMIADVAPVPTLMVSPISVMAWPLRLISPVTSITLWCRKSPSLGSTPPSLNGS